VNQNLKKKNLMIRLFFIIILLLVPSLVSATDQKVGQVTGLPIPRFVVIKSRDVNMRSGPGVTYQSKINYKCIFTPVEVKSEFDNWRLVKDSNGNEGWIHEAMLDGRRYVQILNNETLIFRLPDPRSQPIARVEKGAIGKLVSCKNDWCQISFGRSYKGWVNKNSLWGVYSYE
jgi:SH3-like domain-containing protein